MMYIRNENGRIVFLTRSGLQIGRRYEKRAAVSMSRDSESIQRLLIEPPPLWWEWVLDEIDRWTVPIMVVILAGGLLFGAVMRAMGAA